MTVFVLFLLALALAAIFSVQNAVPVTIVFLFWSLEASLAIVVFVSVLGGAVAAAAVYYLLHVKRRLKSRY